MAHQAHINNKESSARAPLDIAICGGGASAVLLLLALKHHARSPVHVRILEPRSELGLGLAYSSPAATHLLNTRACNMSVTDDPDNFVHWLRKRRRRRFINWTGEDFAPRSYFAAYLRSHLTDLLATTPHVNVEWLKTAADSIASENGRWEIVPAQGSPFIVDAVIVATGNEPPRPLGAKLPPAVRDLVIEDPWDTAAKARIPQSAPILLAGSGLTTVDIVTELLARQHTGAIIAVSPRGLLPRPHGPIASSSEGSVLAAPASLRELIRHVRQLCVNDPSGEKWRRVVVELRTMAPSVWRGWSVKDKKRFIRHVRPFWEVHRHRLPPRLHARITGALANGRLGVVKGRIGHIEPLADKHLRVSVKYARGTQTVDVARIINCTGPEMHPARSQNPLLRALLDDGTAREDITGLGFAVDSEAQLIGSHGSAHRGLYAFGALTRGARWEVTSIPELRAQAKALIQHALHEFGAESAVRTREAPLAQSVAR